MVSWVSNIFFLEYMRAIAFTDIVDLWVIKIKKPIILCARSTSRSREQSTKRRSRSENM